MAKRLHKKISQDLISLCCDEDYLSLEKVQQYTKNMNRNRLKQCICEFKNFVQNSNVFIDTPKELSTKDKDTLSNFFIGKKIVYRIDPNLILGLKITDKDMVYSFDLSSRLQNLREDVTQNYD